MSFPIDYIYIISDFKELNYTNTNYVVYSQRKGPVNSKSSQMRYNKNGGFKYEECNMFKMKKNAIYLGGSYISVLIKY